MWNWRCNFIKYHFRSTVVALFSLFPHNFKAYDLSYYKINDSQNIPYQWSDRAEQFCIFIEIQNAFHEHFIIFVDEGTCLIIFMSNRK